MCDFSSDTRAKEVTRPRVGWKITSGRYMTGWLQRTKIEEDKWMECKCIGAYFQLFPSYKNQSSTPRTNNTTGFYIYQRKADALADATYAKQTVQRVLYKGKCVYGKRRFGEQHRGVRAQFVCFTPTRTILRVHSPTNIKKIQ